MPTKSSTAAGVEVGHVVLGRGAALDKVQVGVILDDDERVLKLAGALGVEAEVALQREVELGALGHVDKASRRDHTAPCRAANLWSVGGMSVINFSWMSGSHCGSCRASSMPE